MMTDLLTQLVLLYNLNLPHFTLDLREQRRALYLLTSYINLAIFRSQHPVLASASAGLFITKGRL